jgi:membrane-associated phospholipid phosphatase
MDKQNGTNKTIFPKKDEMFRNRDMRAGWEIKLPLVLSILNSVMIMAFGLSGIAFKGLITETLSGMQYPSWTYFWKENLLFYYQANIMYFVLLFLLSLLMTYSCVLMWDGHRTGVNLFAFAKCAGLTLPMLFFGLRGVVVGDIMLALLFIAYYYLYMFRHLIHNKEE